jgi:hypothetical protein
MLPPDLYRSEAFAEDLPDGSYEPLALLPVRVSVMPAGRQRGLLNALRAAWALRGSRSSRGATDTAVQLA